MVAVSASLYSMVVISFIGLGYWQIKLLSVIELPTVFPGISPIINDCSISADQRESALVLA
jgi:hypothetical protein